MNREILFKGKRIDNGEWAEGHLIQNPYLGNIRSWISDINDKIRLRMVSTYYTNWRAVEVDTSTVSQYTGLTDKNGKKIWENDVVETPKESGYFKIEWEEDTARWIMNNEADGFVVDFDNYWSYEVEVIGNIFENPELLNQ